MAILKDLIVHGSSRFLNKIYASEIQTPLIEAEAGIFKKLKADDATVVSLLDVKGQMHTNSWSNSNIATIDGSFYITPTIGSASGTVTITASSLAFSGTNYAISSLYLGDGSSITWPQYSKVLVTGQILSNGEWIPLGTLLGQLSSAATAASISINDIKDNKNQTSNVLATLVSNGTTSSSYRNLKVSLYQRASSSTAFYPLGIYMTATGTNGRTFLDIYGGVEALSNNNNYGGLAEPNVRIGNLQGLPNVGGQTPSGWGIYTDNGYFKGIIAADKGFIGSGSKYWVIANEEDVSNVENSRSYIYNGKISYNDTTNDGVYLGTDGIGLGKGNFYVTKAGSLTAKSGSIGGWQLDANSFHTGTWGNDNSALICTGTGSSKSIGGSESIRANFGVTKSGALYASSANISGKVVATSGSIGGVNIVDGNLDVSSISIGSLKGAKDFSSDNLLKDVYASSLTKENAQWDRYLSDASNSTITGEFIAEANLPDPNATHFYRITDSSATTKGRALCFYSSGTPPFINGHIYRIGCWVRKHAGSPKMNITLGSVGSWMPSQREVNNTEWEWFEVVRTFGDTDSNVSTQADTYKRLYFYFYNNNVASSSLDMCGFKMEEVQVNSGTARNFLLGTEKLTNWGTVNEASISDGIATFSSVSSNSWREIYPAKNFKYNLIRNQYTIFSIKVKAEVDKKCCINLGIGVDTTETAYVRKKWMSQIVFFTGTGEWQTVCSAIPIFDYMFNTGSGIVDFDNCWVTVRIGAVNTYWNGFQAKEPQLSLGTTATSWSRAPEDVDETIDNVSTVANTALGQSIWYAECSTAAGTAVKVATISPVTTNFVLTKGVTVNVKFTNTNSATNSSLQLNVNGTGAKNIKYIYNGAYTNIVAGYLKASQMYQFRYDGTYWIVQMMYNSNSYDRSLYSLPLAASEVIAAGKIAVLGLNNKLIILKSTSFYIDCPPLYVGTTYEQTHVTNANTKTNNYTYWGSGFNLSNTHSIQNAAANKNVYIVGTLAGNIFTPNTTVLTCAEPSTEDNLYYMLLGRMTSTVNAMLQTEHPIYVFKNGKFQRLEATTATSYITQIDNTGIKITPSDQSENNYLQLDTYAISMYRANIETLRIDDDNIRIGKVGTGNRNVYITSNAVQIRNNTTTLASYGDSIVLGNEDSLSQITLSQTGVVFTPKTIANSTESAGTFKYIVNESGHSYTLVEESTSNQNTGTATADPLRLNNNTYYSNTESFSDVILAKVNNEFWVLGKTNETETSVVVQSIGTDSETWNYNSTPVTKTIITYVTMEETQETTVEQEDGSEEIENIIVQVNYQITRIESWEKWNVTSGTIPENYIYSGYIKKDSSDETNQDLYSINYQKKISTSQSSTGTTLNVNVATDITTSLSFRQMTDFYENKNLDYITTEPDFSILFGKDVWTNSPYSYILGGEKNVIKTNSTIPALYSTIVGGYQNGYFYNKHANTPSLEDTLYKMGIECFIGNGYGNSVQSNLSSIIGGQYNAIYDGESFSVIGGGYNNSIQTWYDDTIPGNTNFYNAPYQFLGGGKDNSSRSDYGVLVGGYNNINLGKYSVISGGASNKTVGQYSVITGGNNNTVLGENSYAHGYLNIAEGNNQTVLGRANIPDSTSLLIVGNGTSNNNRSNALTLNQNGSLTIAMDLNLHSPRSILLAQKSDYSISPSNLMKANRIYANQYAGTMNNYYISQGYHSYYANGNWILSLESAKINSAVPLQAPNNVQWIDNTNNISRANVIYYGSPSTSDHPTATANQPANGWYYYRQLAASGGYNILLGVGMNSNNPTLRIRGRYKDVSTNTYKWTGWIDFSKVGHTHSNYALSSHTHPISDITSSTTTLSITRSISTTYMTATSFARLVAKKKDRVLYFYFNAWFDGSDYSVSDFTTIATISGWSAIHDAVISVPCQNDGTKVITIMVTSTGTIRVYSAKAISGWYRAFICVPSSS